MNSCCRIRLLCPAEGDVRAKDYSYLSGSGFRWVSVVYEVNPVGSKSLYKITKCLRNDVELDLEVIGRLNPDTCVDEAIAAKVHGAYAKEVQKTDDLGQLTMKLKPKKGQPVPTELDLGELFPV